MGSEKSGQYEATVTLHKKPVHLMQWLHQIAPATLMIQIAWKKHKQNGCVNFTGI